MAIFRAAECWRFLFRSPSGAKKFPFGRRAEMGLKDIEDYEERSLASENGVVSYFAFLPTNELRSSFVTELQWECRPRNVIVFFIDFET